MIPLAFVACAIVIFFAGRKLTYYGNLIAEYTGMAKGWIGLILMASVTSLPELVVGISSSAIVKSADLAVGDVFGSCAFNLFILAMMDVFVPRHQSIFGTASKNHVLAAGLSVILLSLSGLGLYIPGGVITGTWVGIISLFCMVVYLFSIRIIYRFEMRLKIMEGQLVEKKDTKVEPLKKIIFRYSLFALMIVIAGLFLPYLADQLALMTGLGKSFVGTLFIAAATSLPELAVSLAAIRMGFIDLAVGNLLGSNIFNILILSLDDVFYTKGVLLEDASDINIISVFSALIMTAIAIIGLTYHAESKRYRMAWDAFLILGIYIGNIFLLYKFSS